MSDTQIIDGYDIRSYHSDRTHLGKTMTAKLLDNPARFWHAWNQKGDADAEKETKSQYMGVAAHMAGLEPERFKGAYHIIPSDMVKNASHGVYKVELAKAGARAILKKDEEDAVREIGAVLSTNPVAVELLIGPGSPIIEQTIRFIHPDFDLPMQSRPDVLHIQKRRTIVNLKTTGRLEPETFFKTADEMHYDLSVAIDAAAVEAAYGEPLDDYFFLVIETKAPFLIEAYSAFEPMDDTGLTYLKYGQYRLHMAMEVYDECTAAGKWPGYNDKITPMKVPDWSLRKLERKLNKELNPHESSTTYR